jgi:hypothetical protein
MCHGRDGSSLYHMRPSPNGSVLVARMINGGDATVLTTHVENGGLKIPMSVMVLDQKNKAVRIVIDEDAIARH